MAGGYTVLLVVGPRLPWITAWSPPAQAAVLALLTWVLMSMVGIPFTSPRRFNAHSSSMLISRIAVLRARLRVPTQPEAETEQYLQREVATHLEYIETQLSQRDVQWVMGTAYIDVWERFHRAEEAAISSPEITGEDDLTRIALKARLRLQDAKGLSADLGQMLDCVVSALGIKCLPPAACIGPAHDPAPNLEEARRLLRSVVFAVNDFRDKTWAGLVRLRNLTWLALTLTGLSAYAVLVFAVVAGTPAGAIVAGIAYFLIAATVGVLNRLWVISQTDAAVDDYGLSHARLFLVPIVSGLAGVAGVYLSAVVFSSGFGALLQPGTASAARGGAGLPALSEIFDLGANRAGLLFALLFGFAPVLLINSLSDLASTYKNAISSTELHRPGAA